jgi:hypothetical protein
MLTPKRKETIIKHLFKVIHHDITHIFSSHIKVELRTTMKYRTHFIFFFLLYYFTSDGLNTTTHTSPYLLVVGDSLIADYYDYGRGYHAYTIRLSDLFSKINIRMKV